MADINPTSAPIANTVPTNDPNPNNTAGVAAALPIPETQVIIPNVEIDSSAINNTVQLPEIQLQDAKPEAVANSQLESIASTSNQVPSFEVVAAATVEPLAEVNTPVDTD